MISLPAAVFLGFIFETLFFGVFLITFGISSNLQWSRHKRESLTFGNKLVFAFSILLFLFITTHWWLNLWGVWEGFLKMPTEMAREMYFANAGAATSLTRLVIYEIQTWMGDALLIYRLYHVAGRKWAVVVAPALMCCALIFCSSHFLFYSSKIDLTQPQTLPATLSLIRKWAIATFSLTVAENMYCLGLIAFFIWKTHRGVRRASSSSLQSVLRIFIESAGIWVLFIFITFMVYLADESAVYIPLYLTNPILGISFCMMTVRLQLRSKATVVGSGSGNSRPPYISNFKTGSKEHGAYTADSATAPNEIMVFSSKRTVDESTFDATASEV